MKRTTIFADDDVLGKLRAIAQREHITLSEVIRTALQQYVSRRRPRRAACSLIGIGRSGRKDVAEHAEELLGKGFGR
jgi:predicted transcriptional regulator